jgi:hypothetical protein
MMWLTKWMVKRLMKSLEITFNEVCGSDTTFNVSPMCDYDLRQIGSHLIQRGWNQTIKEDEHLYHKGQQEIVINFEVGYVCVIKLTPPQPSPTLKLT